VAVVLESDDAAKDTTAWMSHVDAIPDDDLAFTKLAIYLIDSHTFIADMTYSVRLAIENDPIITQLHGSLETVFLLAYVWHLKVCPMSLVIFKKGRDDEAVPDMIGSELGAK
jgi:hypothetical protein